MTVKFPVIEINHQVNGNPSMYNVLIADDHAIVRSGIAYLIDKQPTFQVVGQTANGTDLHAG